MRAKPASPDSRLSFIEFQLPSLADEPPEGDGWLHEIKHDGYRTQLVIERGKARALTRRGFDWSSKYGDIVEAAAALPVKSAILDGEVIVFNEDGRSDFAALRSAISPPPSVSRPYHAVGRRDNGPGHPVHARVQGSSTIGTKRAANVSTQG